MASVESSSFKGYSLICHETEREVLESGDPRDEFVDRTAEHA